MDPEPGSIYLLSFLLDQLWIDLLGQLVLFVLFMSVSFIVSGAESAFFSLSKPEIDEYKERDTPNAHRILRLINDPKRLLATILITNNFANIITILLGAFIIRRLSESSEWVARFELILNVGLITAILLVFGEIVPKVYFARNRLKLVGLLAGPLGLLKFIFGPLAFLLVKGTQFIDRKVQLKESNASLEDLKHAIDLTRDDIADKEEKEILKGIVNFSNITVKSIMRARVDVIAIDIDMGLPDIISVINENGYSRLPVYEENLDNVKGVLHIKDLLPYLNNPDLPLTLSEHLRKVRFIPESKKIDSLLEEFKAHRLHMAVVVDEFGGTAGIVTLEDVIEEIFGEINDEFDSEDWVYTKISEDTYIFEGRISLIDVKKILKLEDEIFEDARGDSDSLAGLILELHGKIPDPGDIIRYQHFELHVESVSKNRITMVKFIILPQESPV
ncbi:MAG: gliding motility-associated protein GldE [Bacteroidota bacterium]